MKNRTTSVALIGGFRPQKCGIATFTTDVFEQLSLHLKNFDIDIYEVTTATERAADPAVVSRIIKQDLQSYIAAADLINASCVDAVWIQHEFGIFGGIAGDHILSVVDRVIAPVVVTLHTVLTQPDEYQTRVMLRLIAKASRLVVMTQQSKDVLISVYGADPDFIDVVEHGAPDRAHLSTSAARRKLGLRDRFTIMTFGLLGPGKGLETAIRALPAILARQPDTIYRIVGATHPNLVAAEGEAYRDSLKALAESLDVAHAIEWVERFLDANELLDQLASCDIYLTPYPNLQQSTSGTLAYAVALGCAVVSTPYVHARELLPEAGGILVAPGSPEAISDAVTALIDNPGELAARRSTAYTRGRRTIWKEFAQRSAEALRGCNRPPARTEVDLVSPGVMALERMIDNVGIFQHSRGIVPDRAHGYCVDDNARALMLSCHPDSKIGQHAVTFAAFVTHAWNGDTRSYRNFMGYDRRWLEANGSDDSNGRTLWALGYTARHAADPAIRRWALTQFKETADCLAGCGSIRALAFKVLGACHVLHRHPDHRVAHRLIADYGHAIRTFAASSIAAGKDWRWAECTLTYDNPRLAEAMLALSGVTGDKALRGEALSILDWLYRVQTTGHGHFRPIGSDTFKHPGSAMPFDQQPVEVWAMVDACARASQVDDPDLWSRRAVRSYQWFFGHNDRGLPLADTRTGNCHDGLTPIGINTNAGAESLLAFHFAHHTLSDLLLRRPTGLGHDKRQSKPQADANSEPKRGEAYPKFQ